MIVRCLLLLFLSILATAVPHEQIRLSDDKQKVAVELFVMSKCPDAQVCEATIDRPLSSTKDLVEPRLVFIGTLNETTGLVHCKHGPSECRGNRQQLCMMNARKDDWPVWWQFIQCMRYTPSRIGDDSLARDCAKLVKVEWTDELQECVDGKQGASLLRESVKEARDRHVKTSCSIYINKKLACVRDDATWRECPSGHEASDFARSIRNEFNLINPKYWLGQLWIGQE